jgi:SAM-dependent methyltransferase
MVLESNRNGVTKCNPEARCPLCRSSSNAEIHTIATSVLCKQWGMLWNIDVSRHFAGVQGLRHLRCLNCGLQFFEPAVCGDSQLYEELSRQPGGYYPAEKWEYKRALARIPVQSSVLDVGCGRGEFLKYLSQYGHRVTGLELSSKAVEESKNWGLDVRHQTVVAAAEAGEKWDVVTSFQVLEHVDNPRSFLEACVRLVRNHGLLILGVPNNDAWVLKNDPMHVLDTPPHHVTRWTVEPFGFISQLFPLSLEKCEFEPLAKKHVKWFLSIMSLRVEKTFRGGRFFRPTIEILLRTLLRFGFVRACLRGHTMLVIFQKNA